MLGPVRAAMRPSRSVMECSFPDVSPPQRSVRSQGTHQLVTKLAGGGLKLGLLLCCATLTAHAQQTDFTADFEAPAYHPGTIHGQQFLLMVRLGNVTGYRREVSGTPTALDAIHDPTAGRQPNRSPAQTIWQYNPYGREIRSTGPTSEHMPYQFNTKYPEGETGLVYYGYRFYDPDRGRWFNRDPIGENVGDNLYEMMGNGAVYELDKLGLFCGMGSNDSLIPDGGSLTIYDFTLACQAHGNCYDACGKTRKECDGAFLSDMEKRTLRPWGIPREWFGSGLSLLWSDSSARWTCV